MSKQATIEQESASPRSFSARSLGYAGLVLLALASRDAVAQTPRTIAVTLLPGESTKSIQAPGDADFVVSLTTPIHLCDLPTTAPVINALLADLVGRGELQQALTRIENGGTASDFAIAQGFSALTARDPKRYIYTGGTQSFSRAQVAFVGADRLPLRHTFATGCLNVDEARALLNVIRGAIRTYLGLPAPTN